MKGGGLMTAQHQPIGVFDSGVGGISTLAELAHLLPGENFVYYGDTAHAPYGTKPREEVLSHVRTVMETLLHRQVKAVVIACNTATAVAAADLRARYDLPIIGMEPALKPASEHRRQGRVLVLATPVTLTQEKFARLYDRYGEGAVLLPCPGLMDLVEQEDFAGAESYLQRLLEGYLSEPLDAVVLGCTHYVFLKPILRRMLPDTVEIFDGNLGVAQQLRRVLAEKDLLLANAGQGSIELSTSGDEKTVLPQMERLLERARSLVLSEID